MLIFFNPTGIVFKEANKLLLKSKCTTIFMHPDLLYLDFVMLSLTTCYKEGNVGKGEMRDLSFSFQAERVIIYTEV